MLDKLGATAYGQANRTEHTTLRFAQSKVFPLLVFNVHVEGFTLQKDL